MAYTTRNGWRAPRPVQPGDRRPEPQNTNKGPAVSAEAEKYYKYGMLYKRGDVVPKNLVTAAEYFIKAAGMGHVESMAHAGAIYAGLCGRTPVYDKQKGVDMLREAASKGSAAARQFLYFINMNRSRGGGPGAAEPRAAEAGPEL